MRRVVGYGLLALVVGSIVVAWVLAGDLYTGGGEDVRTVAGVGRDDPVVARALADAGLVVPDTAHDFAAQVSGAEGFSAVAFTLPAAEVAGFLTASSLPASADDGAQVPPPLPALGWQPRDPSALFAVRDTAGGAHRLVALDLADPDATRILARSTPTP
jgi:hypothetical protein